MEFLWKDAADPLSLSLPSWATLLSHLCSTGVSFLYATSPLPFPCTLLALSQSSSMFSYGFRQKFLTSFQRRGFVVFSVFFFFSAQLILTCVFLSHFTASRMGPPITLVSVRNFKAERQDQAFPQVYSPLTYSKISTPGGRIHCTHVFFFLCVSQPYPPLAETSTCITSF